MAGLRKYVECMTRGRQTDRIAYVMREWDMPAPLPGAEWQLDPNFNAAEELLRDPALEAAFNRVRKGRRGCNRAQVEGLIPCRLGGRRRGKWGVTRKALIPACLLLLSVKLLESVRHWRRLLTM